MKPIILILALAFLLVNLLNVSVAVDPILLNRENFTKSISNGTWLVNFMSPYCPHCEKLAPAWRQLADDHAPLRESKGFHIAEVDCSLDGDLADENEVTGTPTLLLYQNGKKIEKYRGIRDLAPISRYIVEKADQYYTPSDAVNENDKPKTTLTEDESITKNDPSTTSILNQSGTVIVLGATNFDTLTASGPWFIKFFAPWCPHCKDLAPIWEELAGKLKGEINVGSVDCTLEGDLCSRYEIRGYPTLKLFMGKDIIEYKGSRKLPELLNFAEKASNAGIIELTAEKFDQLKKKEVHFIYLYDDKSPPEALRTMDSLARSLFSIAKIYSSKDKDLALALKVSQFPAFIVLKDDIQKVYPENHYEAFSDVESLRNWIDFEKYPIVSALNSENSEEILSGERLIVLGIFDPKGGKSFTKAKASLNAVARHYFLQVKRRSGSEEGRAVLFAWLDGNKWSDYIYRVYGLSHQDLPAVLISDPTAEEYFDKTKNGDKILLENQDNLFEAIHDVKKGLLKGTSTMNFIEKAVKNSYQKAWSHPYVTLSFFGVSLVGIWHFFKPKKVVPVKGYPKFE
ncbi:hypothetical protein G9A89_012609 [Geosiphon pyriformis]|nr:hypothetical protein G9A89_012609 [Geosiphon pyriformis]